MVNSINSIKRFIKKMKLSKLFYNNKFTAFFSIISSFVLWIMVSSSSTESVPVTISDIPVDITLSESAIQDGLRVFSGQDITARVEVTGNRLIVGQLTKNDIQVSTPQSVNTIMSPGNYTLELSAKKVGIFKDYELTSDVKPSMVTVMVDRYRESEFEVIPEIEFNPKPGYFVGSTVLSNQKVILSGPETEISKIKKVVVRSIVSGESNSTINLKLPVIMYDAYDKPLTSETITINSPEVEVSIPILMKKEVKIEPTFSNLPEGIDVLGEYKDLVKVYPSKLEIAGPENILNEIKSLSVSPIDFTSLNMQTNKLNLPISLPQSCRSLNNIYSVDVNLNMSLFREKTLSINQFSFLNIPENKKVKVYNGSVNVEFIGSSKSINTLKPSDIIAEIDFSGKEDNLNSMEMPINIVVEGYNDVWVSNKYFVNVSLSNKGQ